MTGLTTHAFKKFQVIHLNDNILPRLVPANLTIFRYSYG